VTNPTAAQLSPELQTNISLAELSTLKVGGIGQWLVEVQNLEQLRQSYNWAKSRAVPILYLGDGSNIIFSDKGFPGLLIQNRFKGRNRSKNEVEIGSAENLEEVIAWLNHLGLQGMERMFGIPGTIGGALVGNAGAYGQEIGKKVIDISVFIDGEVRVLPKSTFHFLYRNSAFKQHPDWFILKCKLRLSKSSKDLQQISDDILSKRLVKYPTSLRCPGSFFKNVVLDELSQETTDQIPDDFVMFGKIPAGKLLEAVGANGIRKGEAQFADYHGNLMINLGQASSQDILKLADEYAGRVLDRFGIQLQPEVVIIDNNQWPYLQTNSYTLLKDKEKQAP